MKTISKMNAVVATVALVLGAFAAESMAQVNGRNVQLVISGDANGNQLGTLRNMGDGTWLEDGLNGRQGSHVYREVARDEWSVYLHHDQYGSDLQIDLYQGIINYRANSSEPMRELYKVNQRHAGPTGRLATHVDYNDAYGTKPGYFTKRGNQWIECNSDGQFCFEEEGRGDWGVFLVDRTRGTRIQLDLFTKQVKYTASQSELYKITNAR